MNLRTTNQTMTFLKVAADNNSAAQQSGLCFTQENVANTYARSMASDPTVLNFHGLGGVFYFEISKNYRM